LHAPRDETVGITHVITGLEVGGAERMLVKVLSRLDRSRYQPTVVSLTDRGPLAAEVESLGVTVTSVGLRATALTPADLRRVVSVLAASAPDVVQTWMYKADLLGGLAAMAVGRPPVIWGLRQSDLHATRSSPSNRLAVRVCAGLSWVVPTRILCVSDEVARVHRRLGYAPGRMVVVPNGFDTDRFRPDAAARSSVREALGIAPGDQVVGLVARFDAQKDHRTFLAAARRIVEARPATRFVLCGDGVDAGNRTLQAWVVEQGLAERVALLGVRADMPAVTAAFDVAVSSSAFGEGFSNAIGEAMACGVPCAVTDSGNSRSLVGDTGRVVPVERPGYLAAAVVDLLAEPSAARIRRGEAARGRIVAEFGLDGVTRRYEQLYEEVRAGVRLRGAG
jgi:glycosyltransferase involved in cell wall biosynthesis